MNNPIGETNTVRLRAMEPEDLDLLYRIENDVRLWNVGASNVPYSRYTLHEYIASASGDIYSDKQVRLMVENGEGEVVGIVDIVNFDPANRRGEVGLLIEDAHRQRGYALAAMQALEHYARQVLHLHQLYAVISVENTAPHQLFRKLGYKESARLSEWLFDGDRYVDAVVMQHTF